MFKKDIKNNKGFTLIELMVSISVFMMIMLVAMSSLFIALDVSKRARALRYSMDNVNFAMDSISRSIRMGTNYTCDDMISIESNPAPMDCVSESTISFIPQDAVSQNDRVSYYLETDNNIGSIQRCVYKDSTSSSCVGVTSSNVDIEELKFRVIGSSKMPTDTNQAKVYIYMKGIVTLANGDKESFAIQTLSSQRNLD